MTGIVYCPKCEGQNSEGAMYCRICGAALEKQAVPAAGGAPVSPASRPAAVLQSAMAPSKSPYAALRHIASLCRLLGWGFVGLAALQALGGLIVLFSDFLPGLGIIIVAAIMGAIGYIFWNMVAESISVILDIEFNTRRTAELLAGRG